MTMTVQQLKRAVIMCASIHAQTVAHAPAMLNARLKIIAPSAFAQPAWLAIHLRIASPKTSLPNQNVPATRNARPRCRVLISAAAIHAPIVIHAPAMLNVVFHSIVHCAIAHWDGVVIHKFNATNVRIFFFLENFAIFNIRLANYCRCCSSHIQPNAKLTLTVRTIRRVTTRNAWIHARMVQHNAAVAPNVWHRTIVPTAFVHKVRRVIQWFPVCAVCASTTKIVATMKPAIAWIVSVAPCAIRTLAQWPPVVRAAVINRCAHVSQAPPAIRTSNAPDTVNNRNVPTTLNVPHNWRVSMHAARIHAPNPTCARHNRRARCWTHCHCAQCCAAVRPTPLPTALAAVCQFDKINLDAGRTTSVPTQINALVAPVCWPVALNSAAWMHNVCRNCIGPFARVLLATRAIHTLNAHQVRIRFCSNSIHVIYL